MHEGSIDMMYRTEHARTAYIAYIASLMVLSSICMLQLATAAAAGSMHVHLL
jgi:hypothetical protein